MKRHHNLAAVAAVALTLVATSLFADDRHRGRTDDWRGRGSIGQVVTISGRIADVDRERNGYVIELDRGGAVFATSRTDIDSDLSLRNGNRSRSTRRAVRNLERGDWIRATGRAGDRGVVYASRIVVEDERDRMSGRVESIDHHRSSIVIRDDRSGRRVEVDLRRLDYRDRNELARLRRGAWVSVQGEWTRDRFLARRVDVERRGLW